MTVAPTALTAPAVRARIASVPASLWLVGLVLLSLVARVVVGAWHVAPRIFPDEYIYASLGRSLAEGSFTIRGESAGFPAVLEPAAAAPLWLLAGDNLELGYRLVQGMHALVVSLTAIPVYVLARRLHLSVGVGLACAGLTLLLPVLAWSPAIMADTFALPFVLGAVTAATIALDRPRPAAQAAFLLLAGLATLARIQYVVLPVAFLVAALVVSRGSVRQVVRSFRVTVAVLGAGLLVVAAVGTQRLLGYYEGISDLRIDAVNVGRWLGSDLLLLAYASGLVLVPLALVGLIAGVARPRFTTERAFASFVWALGLLVLCQAALYASNGSERFQERYVAAILPLLIVSFCLGARRLAGRGARMAVTAAAACLAVAALAVPLSGYTALSGKQDAPTLWAVSELEQRTGVGEAGLIVALAAGALMLAVALVAIARPQVVVPVVLGLTAVTLAALTAGAVSYDATQSKRTKISFGDNDQSWVDHAGLGDVAVLQTPSSSRAQVSSHLFWNRSLSRILRMEDAGSEVDAYGSEAVLVGRHGTIHAGQNAVAGPLLVEEYASWAQLENARLVRRTINAALWDAEGTPRLALLLAGRYFDGWLGARSSITVWAGPEGRRAGTIVLPLSLPDDLPTAEITVEGPGVSRTISVHPGRATTLKIPFETGGVFRVDLRATRPFAAPGGRLVSVLSGTPRILDLPSRG